MGAFIVEVDPHELACLILEGAMGIKRPDGQSAYEALQAVDDEARAGLYKAAENATAYLKQCFDKGSKVQ